MRLRNTGLMEKWRGGRRQECECKCLSVHPYLEYERLTILIPVLITLCLNLTMSE